MVVQKFGGSSVANSKRIRAVAQIVQDRSRKEKVFVVLSAMKGVTNLLIGAANKAEAGNPAYLEDLKALEDIHYNTIKELFGGKPKEQEMVQFFEERFSDLRDILHGVELVRECSLRTADMVSGFGEKLSTIILAQLLEHMSSPAQAFDASDNLIISDDNHGRAQVFFEESYQNIKNTLGSYQGIAVVTGFVAVSHTGQPTTLGRNGSDFTASILGAGLDADSVEIWTDVDGVLSGDPRIIDETFVIQELSIQEAMELSYFGAEVIHPSTMMPIVEKDIPLWIKNTLNPEVRGTLIARKIKPHDRDITGVASIGDAALLNIEGGGMIGIPGFASRVFGALGRARVNVVMISQASSEHSICLVIRNSEIDNALAELEEELGDELGLGRIQPIEVRRDLEIIAVIGENMAGRPGHSGRLFSALGEAGVNILVIAQGSSERNISFVVEGKDRVLALNTVHHAFLGK